MSAIVFDSAVTVTATTPHPVLQGRKILFMIDEMASITSGGTERQLLQLVELTKGAGMRPEILILRNTHWLTEEIAGCLIHRASLHRIFSLQGMREMSRLVRWIRTQRFDVVQSFFTDANLLGPLLGRAAGIRHVVTSRRNLNYSMTPGRLVVQRLVNRLTTAIVANCDAVRKLVESMERADPRKMHVVYNGIDLRTFTPCATTYRQVRAELGVQDNEILVGCVSAVRQIKGVDYLLEAAKVVLREEPLAKFCVVGAGRDLAGLQAISDADPVLRSRFLWTGPREDVKPYLRAFDLAVLPSLSEGFSNSILEYMAMGLPIIATEVGGNPEALQDGAGILVPPADHEALAKSILQLLKRPSDRMNIGFRAAERVRRWDMDTALRENANFYTNLLTS